MPELTDTEERDIQSSNKPVIRFFKTGWAYLVRLMAVNALFIVFNIPAFVLAYFMALFYLYGLSDTLNLNSLITVTAETGTDVVSFQLFLLLVVFFVFSLVSSGLVCIGPFQAGFNQIYKNIRNGSSVSIFGEFKQGMKENAGKGIAAMVIGVVITSVILLAVNFYSGLGSDIGIIISAVFGVLFFAFILVQNIAYQLMVSTDLKIGNIYKNAILFVLLRFVPCLGAALVVIVFLFIIPFVLLMSASYLMIGIFLFVYMFFAVAWVQYFLAFFSGSLIDLYVSEEKSEKDYYSGDNELKL